MKSVDNASLLVNGTNSSGKYGIAINGSDGYSAGAGWDQQPGYPTRAGASSNPQYVALLPMVTNSGPFPSYHFLSPNPDCVYVELEVTAGCYHRLGFGKMETYGSPAGGGRFFYATVGSHVTDSLGPGSWLGSQVDGNGHDEGPWRASGFGSSNRSASAVRCLVDGIDGWAASGRASNYSPTAKASTGFVYEDLLAHLGVNQLTNRALLAPIVVSAVRDDEYISPIGRIVGIRYMDMTGYLPGDEFTVGSDTWKIFPIYQKSGRSREKAITYLKV